MARFPDMLTADMLSGFVTTERGCTHPKVGEIDGMRFIAKCGRWSRHSSDAHVLNELVADRFLRTAGFNVPASRRYDVDFGKGVRAVRLAEYISAKPLMQVFEEADAAMRARIRAQAIAAYPIQALIAGIDTFTYDNVLVDAAGALWFVDNGASFDFRACGKRKGWFWNRRDLADPETGYFSLMWHPDQDVLQTIVGRVTRGELIAAAKAFRFKDLVSTLPDAYRRLEFETYAIAMDTFSNGRMCEITGDTIDFKPCVSF